MKKIWYSIKTICLSYLVQTIAMFIGIIFYIILNKELSEINMDILIKYLIIAVTISTVPISLFLLKKYRLKETKIEYPKLLLMIPLGVGISLFYNMLTINLLEEGTLLNLNIILLILYTAILGPIYEELVFRYVALRKAKEVYKENTAIIVITTFFALLHTGIISIIYAFIIGLILAYVYKKHKNILYPIMIHISANFTSIFIKGFNIWLLLISIIILVLTYIFLKKQKH